MQSYAVIVDFSHFFHIAHSLALAAGQAYDTAKLTVEQTEGKLRMLRREFERLLVVDYDIVFAEDRQPKRKNQLWPPYRHNSDRVDYSEQKAAVKEHLLQNGFKRRFCHSPDNEADDTIATLTKLALTAPNGQHVIVVTSDRDLWQLIRPRVTVFNPVKRALVMPVDVQRDFQCLPQHIPLYKAIWGDAGDCVPNVLPRMQRRLLPIIKKSDGTLDSLLACMEQEKWYLKPKYYDRFVNSLPQIKLNYELVKLDDQCVLKWE